MKKWSEILIPNLIALILIAGIGYGRLLLVEKLAGDNRADIEKMEEKVLTVRDITVLRESIANLSSQIRDLKDNTPPAWFQAKVQTLEERIKDLEKAK